MAGINGTRENNLLTSGASKDVRGSEGDDTLRGFGGNDFPIADSDSDSFDGGGGSHQHVGLPDGPTSPSWLQLIHYIVRPWEFLDNCANRYGEFFTVKFGNTPPFVVVSNPQAVKEIFTANPEQINFSQANQVLRPVLGDNSLLTIDGVQHKQHRKLLMPPFHGEGITAYSQMICQVTKQATNQWSKGKPFSVFPVMREISQQVILQAVFGDNVGERCQQINRYISDLVDLTASPLMIGLGFYPELQRDFGPLSPRRYFFRKKQQLDQAIYAEIRDRREKLNSSCSDILALLMSARDEAGQPLTDEELRDELVTLLLAGQENTTIAMTWALYWIHRLPDVKQKLLEELEPLGDNPNFSVIARLPQLGAVCSETLRVSPITIFPTVRVVKSPLKIIGREFAPGTQLAPCAYLIHRREDLYPEPEQFKPERFLERKFSPNEYFPFGGGNRSCIGAAFALLEMKLVLATILTSFELQLSSNRPARPVRWLTSMVPAGGLQMFVTRRLKRQEHLPEQVASH